MKKLPLFLLLFISVTSGLKAQIGWQWGQYALPRHTASGYSRMEAWPIAVDRFGNTCTSGVASDDTCFFGPFIDCCLLRKGAYVSKVNPGGNYLWVLHADGNIYYQNTVVSMKTDAAGCLYALWEYQADSFVVGSKKVYNPSMTGMAAYALVKISPSGSPVWIKNVGSVYGGITYNAGIGIDTLQRVYVAGVSMADSLIIGADTLRKRPGLLYFTFLARYDSSGTAQWARSLQGTRNVTVNDIAVTPRGTVYMIGGFYDTLLAGASVLFDSVTSFPMAYIARFDTLGNVVWAQKNRNVRLNYVGVATDKQENIFLSGDFKGNASVGTTSFMPPDSVTAALVAMADSTGAFAWAKAGYGPYANAMDVTVDLCGNIAVCGRMDLVKGIWFGTDTLHAPGGSADPAFIRVFDYAGNHVRSIVLPSGGDDWFWLAADNQGSVMVSGDYYVPFIIGSTYLPSMPAGVLESSFLAKYTYDSIKCPEEINIGTVLEVQTGHGPAYDIKLFPNPASGQFFIQGSTAFSIGATAAIYDLSGKLMITYPLSGNVVELPVGELAAGLYICRVKTQDGTVFVKKIVLN